MKLAITQLAEGDSFFKFSSLKDAWVQGVITKIAEQGYTVHGEMKLNVQLTKLEPDYYMRGNLEFVVDQNCARCAEVFPQAVNHPFSIALAHIAASRSKAPVLADESNELDVHFFEGHDVDLAPIFQEQFFLSLPYQSLCGPECKGVCQTCGSNLNQGGCDCPPAKGLTAFSVLESYRA